jgi:hypothetical protein
MLIEKQIPTLLRSLSPVDAYIFKFYYTESQENTINLIPQQPAFHLKFLQEQSKIDPDIPTIHKTLIDIKRQTFNSRAKQMVDLAKACANLSKLDWFVK